MTRKAKINLLVDSVDRIDRFIASRVDDLSRSKVQRLISDGCVFVDNIVIADCSYKTKLQQSVDVMLPSQESSELSAEHVDFAILYEDDDIVVVDKPSGVVVHPGAGNWSGTLVNGLIGHSNCLSAFDGADMRPGIVHRIDKDTSGILVVAKNDVAHAKLAEQFAVHSITRKYVCFVYGIPRINREVQKLPDGRYRIETQIGRDKINRKKMTVLEIGGKNAITIFKILNVFKDSCASQIECELKTGRTHQIRVHMTHLCASLIGDQVYGRKKKISGDDEDYVYNFSRQALHAKYLKFQHPATYREMEFSSELPNDMARLNKILTNL